MGQVLQADKHSFRLCFPYYLIGHTNGGVFIMKKSGIYCITNVSNNKKYIGQSKDLNKREKEHIRALKGGWDKEVYKEGGGQIRLAI